MEDNIVIEKIGLLESTINNPENSSKLDKENLHFYQTSIQYLRSRLKNTIPIFVQDADLANAASEIDSSVAYLNNFLGDENVGHLTNSKNSIKSAISRLKSFPSPITDGDFNFSNEVTTFKKIVASKNENLEREVSELKNNINKFDAEIEKRKAELEAIEDAIKLKNTEIERLSKTFEDQYDKDRAKHIEQLSEQEELIKSNTVSLVNFLENKKNEAAKIVNVIGNIGATGNFQRIANEHEKSANNWRFVAMLFMAGLSGLVIWSVISLGAKEFDWVKSVLRIIAAAVLSYPATYASRESAKHRKLENFNRKLELELSSIDAFIELLPDEKKQVIKEKLAEKYFGSTIELFEDADLKSDKDFSLQSIERLFKAIEPILKK
jgi:hypothetical protein